MDNKGLFSNMAQEILTIKQVAEYLQLNEKTIYRMVKTKGIPFFKVGGSIRFRKTIVEKWIDSLSNANPTGGRETEE